MYTCIWHGLSKGQYHRPGDKLHKKLVTMWSRVPFWCALNVGLLHMLKFAFPSLMFL